MYTIKFIQLKPVLNEQDKIDHMAIVNIRCIECDEYNQIFEGLTDMKSIQLFKNKELVQDIKLTGRKHLDIYVENINGDTLRKI